MKDKINVYIEKNAFERIIINNNSFKNLLAIFSEHSVIHFNMTEDEINKEWDPSALAGQRGGSKILKFFTGHSMKRPSSANDVFKEIQKDEHKFLDYCRSIFVLNISPEEAKRLRADYGLMILSNDGITDDVFQFHMRDSVNKGEIKDGFIDGWDYFFGIRKHSWLPSNVLIFSDEHLFKNEEQGVNLGVRNLKSIIQNIVPNQLNTVFQILVVSGIPRNNVLKAKKISDELTNYVHTLPLPYTCQITFVFTNTTHTRKALSNYYIMTCDKGFALYSNNPLNKVHDTNYVDIISNFHSVSEAVGTTGYDDTSMCLKEITAHCKEAQEQARAGIKTVLISGDCGPNFEINNRLLSCFLKL